MNYNQFKKVITLGIIILLFGAFIIPSMQGYNIRINSRETKKNLTLPRLDNNFVNAYWKFDTGNGNIVYDISGNNFNGTINGANWTNITPLSSGYALDFDGIDDYVDFDTHSVNLGFNKTDDLLFSFYFNTSTTKKGMLYSTSSDTGTNPEFHIFVESNGSIAVKADVTNCGFEIYSNSNYSDGNWHYLELFYNGEHMYPTTSLYIDNQFETNVTCWICPFDNIDFTKAKIGRRGHNQTDFFQGKIDEFKITKYPGGNEQSPPLIDGPQTGEPEIEYYYNFTTNDPEGDNISLEINWDDGNIEEYGPYTSGEEVNINHEWIYSGSYNITARSKDSWSYSIWSDPYEMKIGNQPPSVPEIDGPFIGEIDEEIIFTFLSEDYDQDDIKYFIDWGDGQTEWTDFFNSGEQVSINHSWDLKGDYEIKAKASDIGNRESNWTEPYVIRIGNLPPDAPDIDGPKNGRPNIEYTFSFKTDDPEQDDVYFEIEWGDKTNISELGPISSGEEINVPHIFTERKVYKIKARAKDSFGFYGDWEESYIVISKSKSYNVNILRLINSRIFIKFLFIFKILVNRNLL